MPLLRKGFHPHQQRNTRPFIAPGSAYVNWPAGHVQYPISYIKLFKLRPPILGFKRKEGYPVGERDAIRRREGWRASFHGLGGTPAWFGPGGVASKHWSLSTTTTMANDRRRASNMAHTSIVPFPPLTVYMRLRCRFHIVLNRAVHVCMNCMQIYLRVHSDGVFNLIQQLLFMHLFLKYWVYFACISSNENIPVLSHTNILLGFLSPAFASNKRFPRT